MGVGEKERYRVCMERLIEGKKERRRGGEIVSESLPCLIFMKMESFPLAVLSNGMKERKTEKEID